MCSAEGDIIIFLILHRRGYLVEERWEYYRTSESERLCDFKDSHESRALTTSEKV